jgi:serine/threonine-protein kinase RsbW
MDKAHDNKYMLVINSDICYLKNVEEFFKNVFQEAQICKEKFKPFFLCVSEGVSNAIIHGNKNKLEKEVGLKVEFDGKEAIVTIEDEGEGFNFSKIPNPTIDKNLKKEKGRGLYIIRTFAKEVKFFKRGSILKIKFDLSVEDSVLPGGYS